MKKHRGFTLLEVMVVVAVVGLGSTVAVFAMSEQVGSARSRSDRIGIALKLKTERDRARERLTGLSISVDAAGDAHTVRFHKALITVTNGTTECNHGAVVGQARFAHAQIDIAGQKPCLDENGRPVGSFVVPIVGDDGETDVFTVDGGGGTNHGPDDGRVTAGQGQ